MDGQDITTPPTHFVWGAPISMPGNPIILTSIKNDKMKTANRHI